MSSKVTLRAFKPGEVQFVRLPFPSLLGTENRAYIWPCTRARASGKHLIETRIDRAAI
jgi:hypothetical protein